MKRTSFPVANLKGGLDVSLDAVFLTNESSPNLEVIRFHKGLLKKDLGFRQFEDDAPERPMLLDTYYQYDGSGFTILCTVDHAYKLSDDAWVLISNIGGEELITTAADRDFSAGQGNWVVVAGAEVTWDNVDMDFACTGQNDVRIPITLTAGVLNRIEFEITAYTSGTLNFYVSDTSVGGTANSTGVKVFYVRAGSSSPSRLQFGSADFIGSIDNVSVKAPTFTGDEDNAFRSITHSDLWIVTNGKDDIMKWDDTTWAALPGAVGNYKCQCLASFYSSLIMGYTIESGTACPYRIRWSDTGDPENWTTGNAGFVDLMDTIDFITALVPMGDRLFVFRERSIWELVFTGDTGTAMFEPRLIMDGIGTYAGKTCVNLGLEVLFFGSDAVYSFDGLNVDPLSNQLFPMLYETGDRVVQHTTLNRAVAEYIEETGDYIIALPTSGSDDPNLLLKYNTFDKCWSKRSKDIVVLGLYSAIAQATWASSAGTNWNNAIWDIPWKRKKLPAGSPTTLYMASDNVIEEDDRTTYSTELMIWESKDFVLAEACRWLYVVFEAKGGAFSASHSFDQGRTWSGEETLTPDESDFRKMVYPIGDTHKQMRLRIRTYNEKFELKWLTPYYIPRKRQEELF